jgi:hypothetical protein
MVVLDKWDLEYGNDLPHFMEMSVRKSDFVVIICTPTYSRKADAGSGGAGYEKQIVTGEMFQGGNSSKFIPLVRSGSNHEALPSFLKSKNYIDFRDNSKFDGKLKDLLHQLHRVPKHPKPRLGPSPFTNEQAPRSESRKSNQVVPGLPPHLKEAFTPPQRSETKRRGSEGAEWDIEEKFDLESGEYQEIPLELMDGTGLTGFVDADGKVSVYLLGTSSLKSFDEGLRFNYFWGREDVTYIKVSYEASETRTHHFVVSNGYEDEEDEDERDTVSVEVKLQVE